MSATCLKVPTLLFMLLTTILSGNVFAQLQGAPSETKWMEAAREWVAATSMPRDSAQSTLLRVEVAVGALDPRLRLAPCQRVEPYVPTGLRLWGRTRIGVRCVQGESRWNVFIPVTVSAFGKAWVLKSNIPSGSVLQLHDAVEAEVDWAAEANAVLPETRLWVGQVASRPLNGGQTLRAGMLKAAAAFQPGTQIRVLASGPGFEIASDGTALSVGVVGESARIRMENGRIMAGKVLDARTVKLEL